MYQQQAAQDPNMGAQGAANEGPKDDNVVDADFKVDEDK